MWLFQRAVYLSLLIFIASFGVYNLKKMGTSFRFLTITVATTFFFELLAAILALTIKNNLEVYELFSFFQVILFSIIYYNLFSLALYKKLVILFLVITLSVLCYELIFLKLSQSDLNIISRSLLFIIFSLLLFRNLLLTPGNLIITKTPAFWLNVGMLFFFTINILFWSIYSTELFNRYNLAKTFSYLLYFSNLIFYILIFMALNYEIKGKRNE